MSSGKSEGIHSGPYGAAVMTSLSWFSGNRDPSRKFKALPLEVGVELKSGLKSRLRFDFFKQDRPTETHAVQPLQAGELQHRGDLRLRRAGLQRALDMAAHT